VPKHNLLLKIIDMVGSPIIGTSANKSGSTPKYDIPSIIQDLSLKNIHLWIDGGRLPKNPPSTIIDLTDPSKPILLRRGRTKVNEIFKDLA
ncbi:MAG: Sua5/YciO/YrdC/YwlC family protein, partial [Candidatus Heimdallarchaeota archaeon]